MDALEFLKERKRICYLNDACDECPFESECGGIINKSDEELKKIVDITEKWSKEHPAKTLQDVFLEQFPEAELDGSGVITICPAPLSDVHRNGDGGCKHPSIACSECRREFWMQEVE